MAMAQTVGQTGKTFQNALMFVGKTMGIGLLLWLFVMILTSTLQIITGIEFVTIEYTYFSHVICLEGEPLWKCAIGAVLGQREYVYITELLDVDVATWIIVGAIDIILQVLHTLALGIGMIFVWLINAFIFGEDSAGNVLNPISLVQILKLIPIIQNIFVGVHGIDESIIVGLDNLLTAIDDLFYSIAEGFFTGVAGIWHNIAEGILGKRRA